jgi:RNA recognition motif-containing protein
MSNADAATAAIAALANQSLDNRPLTINVARERTEGGSRGGFGGGRSGERSSSYGNR